jgi:hypothetical protein
VAALSEIRDEAHPDARQAQQHASPVCGIFAALDVSRSHEAVGEETCRGKAEAEKLGQTPDRRFFFVAKKKQGAHLLHREIDVAPARRRRGEQGAMHLAVSHESLIS